MVSQTDVPRSRHRATGFAWYKVGAIAYILWGLWHIQVVIRLWQLGATLSEPAAIGVRLQQGAFHILFFVVCAIAVGVMNWRNSRTGFWINLTAIGWTEVGLFWLFILPGTFPWFPRGWVGPTLWLIAVVFTTVGQLKQKTTP